MTDPTKKFQLLTLLQEAKEDERLLSGSDLGRAMDISRQAVWKMVKGMEEEGFAIPSSSGGYSLEALPKALHPEALRLLLPPPYDEGGIRILEDTASTNLDAKNLLDETRAECVIVASKAQSNGRGRLGRSFFSPPGGLYFSFAWRNHENQKNFGLITIFAAVALHKAVQDLYQIPTTIKWVNDVEKRGKKISGILTEGRAGLESGRIDTIVCGIGTNLFTPKGGFPEDIRDRAGALFDSPPGDFDYNLLLARILHNYLDFQIHPDLGLDLYRKACSTLGKTIAFEEMGTSSPTVMKGKALAIDDLGGLVVTTSHGQEKTLRFGEVQILK
ncbi:biotin--[acetyl-CoA-carboxylase] ligase [Kallipyga gabonensis]|uniref:biotin--[acetyl-CoA-carboxylase] ligase n=1 Tax=Kallipyga gabonensis TaxID=1686287 RepID=UPI0006B51142|nr:biotin--[acetyl-CoA-carboxylase] ligase [Kallipyga gabonensis]